MNEKLEWLGKHQGDISFDYEYDRGQVTCFVSGTCEHGKNYSAKTSITLEAINSLSIDIFHNTLDQSVSDLQRTFQEHDIRKHWHEDIERLEDRIENSKERIEDCIEDMKFLKKSISGLKKQIKDFNPDE